MLFIGVNEISVTFDPGLCDDESPSRDILVLFVTPFFVAAARILRYSDDYRRRASVE